MTSQKSAPPQRAYINVMEILVAEEVDRQMQKLPERVLKYVKRLEVETYALNRLPPLYASSEKGWQHQSEKAMHELGNKIADTVRQAFAAVQVDPIRLSQPLHIHAQSNGADAVLQILREWFQSPTLDWKEALLRIRQLKQQTRPVPPPPAAPTHTAAWRPGTYGSQVAWKPKQKPANQDFDWEDNRYTQ